MELKVTINDGKIKIGQVFVGELKKRLIRSQKFTFSASEPARLILRINCQEINELPFQSVVSIIWTAAVPGQGAPREIFLDYLLMVGVSAAHAGKDAEDVLHYTLTKILPRFRVLKKEKNLTRAPGFNAGKAFCKVRTAAHEDKLCIVPTEE